MAKSLVSGYDSEGEEEVETSNNSDWTKCFDESSGYPYYWNTRTNEVSWDQPEELNTKPSTTLTETNVSTKRSSGSPISCYPPKEGPRKVSKPSTKFSKTPNSKKQIFYGPTLPEPKPEEIAKQKILKFEEELKENVIKEIDREVPFDWHETMPRALHTQPFKWDQSKPILPIWTEMVKEKSKSATHSIALIAGVYGDSDGSESEDENAAKVHAIGNKRKMQLQVKSSNCKVFKTGSMKNVPSIFKEDEDDSKDIKEEKTERQQSTTPPDKYNLKKTGPSYKKSIDDIAETLCDKLEALDVASIPISPLKLLAVKVDTLFAAWQSSAISPSYLQKSFYDLSQKMKCIEMEELAPPGWKAIWDRTEKRYSYENVITGDIQDDKPEEETEDDQDVSQDDVKIEPKDPVSTSERSSGASLPPLPSNEPPPLPPPPPPMPSEEEISNPEPSQNAVISSGVQDMDLDEEEESPPIVHNDSDIHDALSSFYASLGEEAGSVKTADSTPLSGNSPLPPTSYSNASSPNTNNDFDNGSYFIRNDEDKKRKKAKFSSSIAIKKKGVGNLVAKWQNIQDEVKRTN